MLNEVLQLRGRIPVRRAIKGYPIGEFTRVACGERKEDKKIARETRERGKIILGSFALYAN